MPLYNPAGGGSPTPDDQTFNDSGTWNRPVGNYKWAFIEGWGSGASGAVGYNTGTAGLQAGGNGGQYNSMIVEFADLGATEAVVIGAIGASVVATSVGNNPGNAGGDSTFGSFFTAKGGLGQGIFTQVAAGSPGSYTSSSEQGAWISNLNAITPGRTQGASIWGGAAGACVNNVSGAITDAASRTSLYGGNGGNGAFAADAITTASNGVAPGGGGGACVATAATGGKAYTSGAGALGRIRIRCF